jgi:imidazoleglycerol phosphate synthase glutamine amidotransferase subunit HisH
MSAPGEVVVVDYGRGNLFSALEGHGTPRLAADPEGEAAASRLILPGVEASATRWPGSTRLSRTR